MPESLLTALTWMAILGSSLIAGVFFAFSTFIMAALASRPAPEGIAAMQAINAVVVRSPFIALFLATGAASALLALAAMLSHGDSRSPFWLAGAVLYIAGPFLITVSRNVPLNTRLAAVRPTSPEGAEVWRHYLTRWTWWNHIRAAAALAAAVAFVIARG